MVNLLDKRVRKVISLKSNHLLREGEIYTLIDCGVYFLRDLVVLAEFPNYLFDARLFKEIR